MSSRQSKWFGILPNLLRLKREIEDIGRADIRPLIEHLCHQGMNVDIVLAREDMFFDYNVVSKNLYDLKQKNEAAGHPLDTLSVTSTNSVHDAPMLEKDLPGIIIDSILSRPRNSQR